MTAFNPGDPAHVALDGVVVAHASNAPVSWLVKCDGVQFWVRPEHLSPVPTPVLFADINVGDRVRAEHVSGTVTKFTVTGTDTHAVYGLAASCVEGHWQFFRFTPPVPPEPEYEVGAVYLSATGAHFLRMLAGDWLNFVGDRVAHDTPVRPLVRLVPEEPK